MGYPILKANNASIVANELESFMNSNSEVLKFEFGNLDKYVEYRAGASLEGAELQAVLNAAKDITTKWSQYKKDKIKFTDAELEQEFAQHLFETLNGLPEQVLQDSDFWRYLTLFPYRWYVWTREGNFKPTRFGGDGESQKSRWTLVRAFLWASKTLDDVEGDKYLAGIRNARLEADLSDGWVIDFYSNNVVRNTMTMQAKVAQALVEAVTNEPPVFDKSNSDRPTDDVAQRVRRLSGNVYFPALERDELVALFEAEKLKFLDTVTE
jgi:hypothetical protein